MEVQLSNEKQNVFENRKQFLNDSNNLLSGILFKKATKQQIFQNYKLKLHEYEC